MAMTKTNNNKKHKQIRGFDSRSVVVLKMKKKKNKYNNEIKRQLIQSAHTSPKLWSEFEKKKITKFRP